MLLCGRSGVEQVMLLAIFVGPVMLVAMSGLVRYRIGISALSWYKVGIRKANHSCVLPSVVPRLAWHTNIHTEEITWHKNIHTEEIGMYRWSPWRGHDKCAGRRLYCQGWSLAHLLPIYMYIRIYVYMYICIYMYIYIYMYINICIYIYIHIYIYIYMCMFVCVCVHMMWKMFINNRKS